jgi:hypothetical protein
VHINQWVTRLEGVHYLIQKMCRYESLVVGVAQIPYWGATHFKEKVIATTGVNQGIGKETTLQLASMGATVILLCRSEAWAKFKIYSRNIHPSRKHN